MKYSLPPERARRPLSTVENQIVRQCTDEANSLTAEIQRIEGVRSAKLAEARATVDALMPRVTVAPKEVFLETLAPKRLSTEYVNAFFDYFRSGGERKSAALTESSPTAGGLAIPSITDQQIVPLAVSDYAVRSISTVVSTVCDRRVARVATLPTASAKTEGSSIGVSTETLGQVTLSAYQVGVEQDASLEIFEDVALFSQTILRDSTLALQSFLETKFLLGSGVGEAQGLLGNIGAGVAAAVADGSGNLLSIAATYDCMGTLKGKYFNPDTRWLMARASAIELRKAQVQSGLFEPVFTSDGGKDYLHGIEVVYSSSMPAVAAGNTPVLFGDFKSAYIIGERGGDAVNMKILDQVNFLNGIISLLVYQRVDGRVRCPEAVQGITLHT